LTGLAVAGRLGSDRGKPLIVAELLEPIDGVIAGVIVGEDLGEEDAQGDPRGVDPLPPEMVASPTSLLDKRPREDLEEGEPLLLPESVSQGIELVASGRRGRLSHGDLLGGVTGGCVEPPSYQPGRSLCSPTRTRDSTSDRIKGYVILVPFVPDTFFNA